MNPFSKPLPRPPDELQHRVGDVESFDDVGAEFLRLFKSLIGLKDHEHVLDVGCGAGRIALPLTSFLTRGEYRGFDLDPASIDWCRENITKQFRNFQFSLVDLKNTHYNPHGQIDPATFRFPYADNSFDFAFLASIFTHTVPAITRNYLSELHRVLRPGGRCLITYFLINARSQEFISSGQGTYPFRLFDNCYVVKPDSPEFTVGYDEEQIVEWHREFGLIVRHPVHYGRWAGSLSSPNYQDVVISHAIKDTTRFPYGMGSG